ncbi:MAG: FxsA family protein [Pararhodobacter sp.]
MPLLLLFILLPLIEIALFIVVGAQIGVGATLALIVLSALLGVSILRGQQARALQMMQGGMRIARGMFLAQGAFRAMAGLLLILPGFLTDMIGLVLLIPPVQRAIVRIIGAGATVATATVWQDDDIVEGEYEVRTPDGDVIHHTRRIDDLRRP